LPPIHFFEIEYPTIRWATIMYQIDTFIHRPGVLADTSHFCRNPLNQRETGDKYRDAVVVKNVDAGAINYAAAKPDSVACSIIGMVVDAVAVTRRMVRPPHHRRDRQGRSAARTHEAFRSASTRVTEPVEGVVNIGYEQFQVLAVRSFGNRKPTRLASERTHRHISAAGSANAQPSLGNSMIFAARPYLNCGARDLSMIFVIFL
jgi:hypothetical protein